MQKTKVSCDHCEADLSCAGAHPAYRLVLQSESLPSDSPIKFAVRVHPPINNPHHFCGLTCLKAWATK